MEDGIDSCSSTQIPISSENLPELPLPNHVDFAEFIPISVPDSDSSFEISNPSETILELSISNDNADSSVEIPNPSDNVVEFEALQVPNPDLSTVIPNPCENLLGLPAPTDHDATEMEALWISYHELRERSGDMEDKLAVVQAQNLDLLRTHEEISMERDALKRDFQRIEISMREREDELVMQLEETRKKIGVFCESLDLIQLVKECMVKIIERIDEEKTNNCVEEDERMMEQIEESEMLMKELNVIYKLAMRLESMFTEHEQKRRKEIKELENSIVSLTEENRDISSLLRIALVEKEAVEKSLSRLKGSGEQKRVAILQIAERGLQKVGFGFMMGASSTGESPDSSDANAGARLDGSACEEEVVSLASTVEKIMKNLRLEISQLKRSLEESRSDSERLQNLTEKQAQKISEYTLYIKDLEERESMLNQNVEELIIELTEAEEEVARWREACELEVEAGKVAMEERDKEAAILRNELEKTKASLELANNKLRLKEELAAAAMAAQAASERSLRLADSRSAGFRERIEELTRQLEEADSMGERKNRRRVRHICWPWRALRINPAAPRRRDMIRRRLPEMESLLH